MKKITVLGAGGMAGHMLSSYLSETGRYQVQNLSHRVKLAPGWITVDVERPEEVAAKLAGFSPDAVVNCVGLLVKESERNPGMAAYVNGYFPHFLERLGKENSFKLIHLSTDCVFSGARGSYSETDETDGKGFYAQSKALGEVVNARDLTIRTSIIGPELKTDATGLFHWAMTSKGVVKGFSKAYWNGVTTLELAKAISKLIPENIYGLCHLVAPEIISKYELVGMIRDVWERKEPEIMKDESFLCDKTLVSTRKDLALEIQDYSGQLRELKRWMSDHKAFYAQYT